MNLNHLRTKPKFMASSVESSENHDSSLVREFLWVLEHLHITLKCYNNQSSYCLMFDLMEECQEEECKPLCHHSLCLSQVAFGWKTQKSTQISSVTKEEFFLRSITYSRNMNVSKLQEIVQDRGAWRAAVHEVANSQAQLSNWTTTTQM